MRRHQKHWTPQEEEIARARYATKVPQALIAQELGRSVSAVKSWRKANKVPWERQKVTPAEKARFKARIRKLSGQGRSDREVGEALGLPQTTVGKWRREMGLPQGQPTGSEARSRRVREAQRRAYHRRGRVWVGAANHVRDKLAVLARGWPAGCTGRQSLYLGLVEAHGPLTAARFTELTGRGYDTLRRLARRGWVVRAGDRYGLDPQIRVSRVVAGNWRGVG